MPTTADRPAQAFRRRSTFDALLDAALLTALAEPRRAALLSCLLKCGRPCSVTEIAACCAIDFSVVSRHLQALAKAGLVRADKQGRTVWYSADGAFLSAHLRTLADAVDALAPGDGCCPPGRCPTARSGGGRQRPRTGGDGSPRPPRTKSQRVRT
jgi:ArsR family transcriptional regulator